MLITENRYYVYQLRLSSSELPFYVGKGTGKRKNEHTRPSNLKGNTHKENFIKAALREGKTIIAEIIESELTEKDSLLLEVFYISIYGRVKTGGCLTNATEGGDGSSGYKHTPEMRKKLLEINKDRGGSLEHMLRMAANNVGRVKSLATIKKLSLSSAARRHSEETKQQIKSIIANKRLVGDFHLTKALLTEAEVIHAYILLHENVTGIAISKILNVSTTCISNLKVGKTWKHICHLYKGISK